MRRRKRERNTYKNRCANSCEIPLENAKTKIFKYNKIEINSLKRETGAAANASRDCCSAGIIYFSLLILIKRLTFYVNEL